MTRNLVFKINKYINCHFIIFQLTIVLALTILSVANYGNSFEFSGLNPLVQAKSQLKPAIKPFSAPTVQVKSILIILYAYILMIVIINSLTQRTSSSQRSDTTVYLVSPSEHHSVNLHHPINLTNRSGRIINRLDLTPVTQDLLYILARVLIKDQMLTPYRLTVSMNPTTSHSVSSHSQHQPSHRSANTSLDHQKNSTKITPD